MKRYFIRLSVLLFSIVASTCGLHANAPRVINTTRDNPPESDAVQEFFTKVRKVCKDSEDQKQINKILEDYRQNHEDPFAWEDAQIKLQMSNISPAKKLETQEFLNLIRH